MSPIEQLRKSVRLRCLGVAFGAGVLFVQAGAAWAGALPPDVVATVNGVPVTVDAVSALVASSHMADTPEVRHQLQQVLIDRELVRQAAEASPLKSDPAVVRQIQSATDSIRIQAYLNRVAVAAPVTDQAVRARYDELVRAMGPTEYELHLIVLARQDVARQVQQKLDSGGAFATLAQQYGLGPTAANGGQLPWLNLKQPLQEGATRGLPMAVAQAVIEMKQGTRRIVSTPERVYIVRLDATRAAVIPGFEDSRGELRRLLEESAQRKAVDDEVARLRAKAQIRE